VARVRSLHASAYRSIDPPRAKRLRQARRVRIGRTLQSSPPSKWSGRLSTHSAFQLGLWTLQGRMHRCRRRGAPAFQAVICFREPHCTASALTPGRLRGAVSSREARVHTPERGVSTGGRRWGAPRGRAGDVVAQKCPVFVLSARPIRYQIRCIESQLKGKIGNPIDPFFSC